MRAPQTTYLSRTPEANANGWNNSTVTVYWGCSDTLSGPVSSIINTQVSSEGADQSATGTCVDRAGNSAPNTQAGINIDLTPPVIQIEAPVDGSLYAINQSILASFTCVDPLSGIDICHGSVPNGSNPDTSSTGIKLFTVQAVDRAGNATSSSVNYRVVTTIIMGPQAMEGDLKVNPGTTLSVGYSFTMPGSHPEATIQFVGTQVKFPYTCVSSSATGSFVVPISNQTYIVPLNSTAWYPNSDQKSPLVYQGSISIPNVCSGGLVRLQQGGTFSTGVTSTDIAHAVNIRWHYKANGSAGSWSGTRSMIPD